MALPDQTEPVAYAGLAVVTESSADHEFITGRPVRRRRKALTRGLNRNHNRVLKEVFKSAAAARPLSRNRRPELG